MNRADGFRIGQSLSREPSRQGMKYMVERNHINVLRHIVLSGHGRARIPA